MRYNFCRFWKMTDHRIVSCCVQPLNIMNERYVHLYKFPSRLNIIGLEIFLGYGLFEPLTHARFHCLR